MHGQGQKRRRRDARAGSDAATSARMNKKFMVIARIEALISGAGEAEALRRAEVYIEAGADVIMIHSSQKSNSAVTCS